MIDLEYRAWDKFNEKMFFSEEFSRRNCFAKVAAFFSQVDELRYSENRVDVMRSSTRRDKNGTRIFAGDIVLKPTGRSMQVLAVIPNTGEEVVAYKPLPPDRCIVCDEGHAFYLGSVADARYYGILDDGTNRMAHDLEVVGHVHEPVPVPEEAPE